MTPSPEALAKARQIAESLFYGHGRGRTRTRMYQELCHALHEIDLDAFAAERVAAAVAKEREECAWICRSTDPFLHRAAYHRPSAEGYEDAWGEVLATLIRARSGQEGR